MASWAAHSGGQFDVALGADSLHRQIDQIKELEMTATAVPSSPAALETKARPWGFLLIQGIAMIIIGA